MSNWGWRRLLQVSAGVAFVLLAAGTVILGPDPIFITFAVVMLVGAVLTRWRTRIGAVVILVPSLAGLLFAAPSLAFVATHPMAFWDISSALFTLLPIAALVNLVAVIGVLLQGRLAPLQSPLGPRLVSGLAIAVVVVIAALGGVARAGVSNANASAGDETIGARDFKFSKGTLDSTTDVSIYVTNSDPTFHTFTIDGVVNEQMPANSNHRVKLTLKPGDYRYYCAVPGHAQTMYGTLKVH